MHPSGKPEVVQPTLGFYFTDQPPTNSPFRIAIKCFSLDIPAGTNAHAIEESYTLPVGVTILRVLPHAHYLAKDIQGYAILPNGEKKWLIWIRDWDFNWQGDYEYAHPQFFPAGTRLVERFTYDNSTNNIRNPSNPPKRVRFGLQTTDEMGEMWFQGLTQSTQDRELLANNYFYYLVHRTMDWDANRVLLDPSDAEAHTRLGHDLLVLGNVAEARTHLNAAIAAKPDLAKAHYELAELDLRSNELAAAYRELMTVLRLDPDHEQAYGNLGYIYSLAGKKAEARAAFEKALQLDPGDSIVRDQLARLRIP
jgi:tetratricopeptide (TPR) repeat protein